MRRSALVCALLLAAGCPGAGCGPGTTVGAGGQTSGTVDDGAQGAGLFGRLGGMEGIRALVDDWIGRVAADPRIQQRFVNADFGRLKGRLVVEVCQVSDGPCRAHGRSLSAIHRPLHIRPAEFDAFLEDAAAALRAAGVRARDRAQVLSGLRALEPAIVGPAP